MTFSLYALLNDEAPVISNESLAADLGAYFRHENGFSLQFERLPFSESKNLALRWDDWLVRVSYEEGCDVKNDSSEIQKRISRICDEDVSEIGRRIRVVFGSDDNLEYTNQIIFIIDYLKEIKGVLIYDPQKNDLLK